VQKDTEDEPEVIPLTGENLLVEESREKLPPFIVVKNKDWMQCGFNHQKNFIFRV
jgi:hypothetical protein